MSKPLVSVIIPVYNAEKFLDGTLASVRNQTLSDIEIICVNDGSTDGSATVLSDFAAADGRFKIIEQANRGGSAARNRGLDSAVGEYIAFLDNDDVYHPQYLEILYNNLCKVSADVSCCAYRKFYGEGAYSFTESCAPVSSNLFVSDSPFADKFVRRKKIGSLMWQKLYKAELFKDIRFSPSLPAINDMLLNIEILLKSRRTVVCKEELIAYRIIETSQTMKKLSLKRIDEYAALAREITALKTVYPHYAKQLENIVSRYAFGMFVDEFLARYKPEEERELYKASSASLRQLVQTGIVKPSSLGLRKSKMLRAFADRQLSKLCFWQKMPKFL